MGLSGCRDVTLKWSGLDWQTQTKCTKWGAWTKQAENAYQAVDTAGLGHRRPLTHQAMTQRADMGTHRNLYPTQYTHVGMQCVWDSTCGHIRPWTHRVLGTIVWTPLICGPNMLATLQVFHMEYYLWCSAWLQVLGWLATPNVLLWFPHPPHFNGVPL